MIVIPETQSQEKKDMLRLCGAELVEVPALPYSNPNNYQHIAKRLADELRKSEPNGVLFGRSMRTTSTIPRLTTFRQAPKSGSRPAARSMASSVRSAPAARWRGPALSCRNERRISSSALRTRAGRPCMSCSRTACAKPTAGGSITEGIGLGRVTPVIADAKVDEAYLIPDEEAVPVIYDLLEHEGLCLGGSTGVNVAGAIRLARQLGPGHTVVTILCDSGNRYQSKLFNPDFMRSKNLPVPQWLERRSTVKIPLASV